jgi:hypothetical protein
LTGLGINSFGESPYSATDRYSQRVFGEDYFDLPPLEQTQVVEAMEAAGETVDDKTKAGPYNYAANGALRVVQSRTATDWLLNAESLQFLTSLGMEDFDITKYDSISKAEDAFVAAARREGATRSQAEGAWDDYRNNVLDIDGLTRTMREEVIREDPSVLDAAIREFEAGRADYDIPDWARDLAEEVRTGATP